MKSIFHPTTISIILLSLSILAIHLAEARRYTVIPRKNANNLHRLQAAPEESECTKQMNDLFTNPTLGTAYYILVNGKFPENWGDYATCLNDSTYGGFYMATWTPKTGPAPPRSFPPLSDNMKASLLVNGGSNFTQGLDDTNYPESMASRGIFFPYSARIGVCAPSACTPDDIMKGYGLFMTTIGQAQNVTRGTEPTFYNASGYAHTTRSTFSTGSIVMAMVFAVMIILCIFGMIVQYSSIGNDKETSRELLAAELRQEEVKRNYLWAERDF